MTTQYQPTQPVVKKQPAPGQSPVGGTTSLPQHLQSPTPLQRSPTDGTMPNTGGGINTGTPTTPPPVPATTPAGTVPPPPPVAAPTPPAPAAAPTAPPVEDTRNKEMGDKLFQELMNMLTNSSRYGAEEANKTREQGIGRLQDEQRLSEDRAKADAAKRGVYYGSPLTNSLGDIGERYNRGLGDLETNIQRDQATRAMEDKMRAIEAIFGLGDRQRMDRQQENDLWAKMIELGLVDGPSIPGSVGAF